MADRRYNETEMAAIFRAAAEGPQPAERDVPREEGMSLAELQAIGQEVGIAPEAVAQAALALDVQRTARPNTLLGFPIGVSRTVQLNRRLSDVEWDRLVVQLREVFHARGSTRSDGSLRQWTNGNLQVLLEPTQTGHRLRFRTTHGAARSSIGAGFVALGAAGVTAIVSAINGHLASAAGGIGAMVAVGVALVASGALRLPRWARTRGRQMEELAVRVAAGEEDTET
jgi:hypothetical protein